MSDRVIAQIATRAFGARTLRELKKRGVEIVDVKNLPNAVTGSYANGDTGYVLSTGQIRMHLEVLAIAAGK